MSKKYKDTEDVVRNIEAAKAKVHPIPAIKYKIASHSMKQRNETQKNKIEFFADHSKLIAEYKASEQLWQNSQETIQQSFSEEIRDNDGISEEYQQLISSFKHDLVEQQSNEEEEENENKEKQQKKNEEYKPEIPSFFSALLPSEEDEKLLSKKRRQENQHQTAEEFRSLWESIIQNERELQNDLIDERRQLFSALRRIKEDVRGCEPETFEGRILEIKENINTFKKKLNQQKTELNKEENEAQVDLDSSVIVNPRTVAEMNLLFAEKFSYFNDYTPISVINALNSQILIGAQRSQLLHSGSALSTQIQQQQSQILKENNISSIMNKKSINSPNKSTHLPVLIKHSSQPQLNTKIIQNQQQNRGNSPLRQQNQNQQKIQSPIKQQQQIEKQVKSSDSSLKSKQRPISNERSKPQIIEAKKDMKRRSSFISININRANSSNSKQQPQIQNQQSQQQQIKQSSPKQPPQAISKQRSSPLISQQPSKSESKFNLTKISGQTVASSSSTSVSQMFVDDLDNISEQIYSLNEKLKNLLTYKPQLEHCADSIYIQYITSQQQSSSQSSNLSTINSKVETQTPFITQQEQEQYNNKYNNNLHHHNHQHQHIHQHHYLHLKHHHIILNQKSI